MNKINKNKISNYLNYNNNILNKKRNLSVQLNNNNSNNILTDRKIKNIYSSYKFLLDDNKKTVNNSSVRRNNISNINHIYNLYKFKSKINSKYYSPNKKINISNALSNHHRIINYDKNNTSFLLEKINNDGQSRNITLDSGNMFFIDQMPQIKKTDLNIALNQRNNIRKKYLDKINSPKNVML
jgi:hypothetical protein